MNLMVRALRANAASLSEFEGQSEVSYSQLRELAALDRSTERLLRAADADPLLSEAFSSAFAAVVPIGEWQEAIASGEATRLDESLPSEWVTIITAPSGNSE